MRVAVYYYYEKIGLEKISPIKYFKLNNRLLKILNERRYRK